MALSEDDCIFVGTLLSFFSFGKYACTSLFEPAAHPPVGLYTVVFGLYVKLVQNRKSSGLTGLDWAIGFLYVVTGVTVILDAIQEFQNLVSSILRLRQM
jgi:hypothetical protein